MRDEREIRDKLDSMMEMLRNVQTSEKNTTTEYLEETLSAQIDMLLWILKDKSGLPPIDEDEIYACYH